MDLNGTEGAEVKTPPTNPSVMTMSGDGREIFSTRIPLLWLKLNNVTQHNAT